MDSLFYWLIDRLIDFLARINPARARKAEAIKAEADRLEDLAKQAEAAKLVAAQRYREESAKRAEWDRLSAEAESQALESQARFVASQTRLRAIEDEIVQIDKRTAELNASVVKRSNDDAFSHAPRPDV